MFASREGQMRHTSVQAGEREGEARLSVPHTQIHRHVRRLLETVQDVVVIVLLGLLVLVTIQALWRMGGMIFGGQAQIGLILSQVVFVLILIELYRTLIFYLREHRVSISLMVEVTIVSILRELILTGVQGLTWLAMLAIGWLLLVLGGLLTLERWLAQFNRSYSDTSAH